MSECVCHKFKLPMGEERLAVMEPVIFVRFYLLISEQLHSYAVLALNDGLLTRLMD